MNSKQRFRKMTAIAEKINYLNDRTSAYTECDQEGFYETVNSIIGISEPSLWEESYWNRQQSYSNIYMKLFLCCVISEIKAGNILSHDILNDISNMELNTWDEFYAYDIGYKTASVIDIIVKRIINDGGFFKRYSWNMDPYELLQIEDTEELSDEALCGYIAREFPLLQNIVKADELEFALSNVSWSLKACEGFEMQAEVIESELLYKIIKEEENHQTELGQKIISLSDQVFLNLIRQDYLNYDLVWKVVGDADKKVYYYMITSSEVLGDDIVFGTECIERLYKYNYDCIFKILELNEKIKKYMMN